MRTVLRNSEEVYHFWANQIQSIGRAGNCSFNGGYASSYNALIGRRMQSAGLNGGKPVFLVSDVKHSVTTSKHQSHLLRAIPIGATIFRTSHIHSQYAVILAGMLEKAAETYAKAGRARSNKPRLITHASSQLNAALEFAAIFELPKPSADIEAMAAALNVRKAEEAASLREVNKIRNEREAAAQAERLARWLAGEPVYGGFTGQYARLRVNTEQGTVQTSFSASVPLAEARKYAHLLITCGEQALAGNKGIIPHESITLGGYRVNSFTADGTMIIGCHKIKLDELKRIASLI